MRILPRRPRGDRPRGATRGPAALVGAVPDRGDRATAFWFLVAAPALWSVGRTLEPGDRAAGGVLAATGVAGGGLMPGGFPAVAVLGAWAALAPARHPVRDASVRRSSASRAPRPRPRARHAGRHRLPRSLHPHDRRQRVDRRAVGPRDVRGRRRNGRPGDLARAGDPGGPPTVARPRRRLDHRRTRWRTRSGWPRRPGGDARSSWCTATPSRSRSPRSSPTTERPAARSGARRRRSTVASSPGCCAVPAGCSRAPEVGASRGAGRRSSRRASGSLASWSPTTSRRATC